MKETHTPYRKFRLDDETWAEYGDVVANRSEDIRDYVHWRIANPETPLPKARRKKADQPKREAIADKDGEANRNDQ